MKIAISKCHGGFSLSDIGFEHYLKLKGIEYETRPAKFGWNENDKDFFDKGHLGEDGHWLWCRDIERDDPALIQTIEALGSSANGWAAHIAVVEIPDDVKWHIADYDGWEWIAENHRTWE